MTRYRRLQIALAATLVGYAAFALGLRLVFRHNEIFPAFTWNLFSTVPNEATDYTIRILGIGGVPLDSPIEFGKARKHFPLARSRQAHFALQRLGKALEDGRYPLSRRLRSMIEGKYLDSRGVSYEVVVRTYHPLEWMRDGSQLEERVIRSFESGGSR
jgi:hypothetical protein